MVPVKPLDVMVAFGISRVRGVLVSVVRGSSMVRAVN